MVHAKVGVLIRPNENLSSQVLGGWKMEMGNLQSGKTSMQVGSIVFFQPAVEDHKKD